jgi:hypothetical protein
VAAVTGARPRPPIALPAALERIVAAGIHDGQGEARLLSFHVIQNTLQGHRVIDDLILVLRDQVGRYQIVGALELHAVSGEVEDDFVSPGHLLLEGAQRLLHRPDRQVFLQRHLEFIVLQRLGHCPGIGARVLQWHRTLVAVIADDKRTPLGVRWQ